MKNKNSQQNSKKERINLKELKAVKKAITSHHSTLLANVIEGKVKRIDTKKKMMELIKNNPRESNRLSTGVFQNRNTKQNNTYKSFEFDGKIIKKNSDVNFMKVIGGNGLHNNTTIGSHLESPNNEISQLGQIYYQSKPKMINLQTSRRNISNNALINKINFLTNREKIKLRDKNNYMYNMKISKNNRLNRVSGFELYYEKTKTEAKDTNKSMLNKNNNKRYIQNNKLYSRYKNNTIKTQILNSVGPSNCYDLNDNFNDKIKSADFNDTYNNMTYKSIQFSNPNFTDSKDVSIYIKDTKVKIEKTHHRVQAKIGSSYIITKSMPKLCFNTRKYKNLSSIRKIILIQSIYRSHLFRQNMGKQKRNMKNLHRRNKSNNILTKERSVLYKNNQILPITSENNLILTELGESFKMINKKDMRGKLIELMKENNDLKNQITKNKDNEENLGKLKEENENFRKITSTLFRKNAHLKSKLEGKKKFKLSKLIKQNQLSFNIPLDNHNSIKIRNLTFKCLFLKKIINQKNIIKKYFDKYKNNIKKIKTYQIENNDIFIDNKKKFNIQMTKNININLASQNDNIKNLLIYKLFIKKEQNNTELLSKFFLKLYYLSKLVKDSQEELNKNDNKKKDLIQSIVKKYERNIDILYKSAFHEWKLRSIIFKMKDIAKAIKKKKKLKKKIKDKLAKEALNFIKNKSSQIQNSHELSKNFNNTEKDEDDKIPKIDNTIEKNDSLESL